MVYAALKQDMKDTILRICSWLIRRGADKWLHFLFGLAVAQLVMLVPLPTWCRIAVSMAAVALSDIAKECALDSFFNKKDLLYTVLGGALGVLLIAAHEVFPL